MSPDMRVGELGPCPIPPLGDVEEILQRMLVQAIIDSSSAIAIMPGKNGVHVRYEAQGRWYRLLPPPPNLSQEFLAALRKAAGIPAEDTCATGTVSVTSRRGSAQFTLTMCTDVSGSTLALLYRQAANGSNEGKSSGSPRVQRDAEDRAR